jgi:hypothetical protein
MIGSAHLSIWVSDDTKQQFAAIARHQGLSESALPKRLIDLMFRTAGDGRARQSKCRVPAVDGDFGAGDER